MPVTAWKYVSIPRAIYALGKRQISTSPKCTRSDLTLLDVNNKTGVATLTMNRPPINALNADLLLSIKSSLEQIEKNNCRGLILTSSLRSVFSAGLDITELYKPDMERLKAMWSGMQDVAFLLSTQTTPVVALINGHAPAGGCVLATSCDYRIMLPNFTIGLNETVLGLVPPKWIMDTLLMALPRRVAELALTKGKLFLSEEAFKVGLVDDVVNAKTEGLTRCEHFFHSFNGVNPAARALTKRQFRFNDLFVNKKADLEWFVGHVTQASIQETVGIYLESLKNKSKK